MGIEVQNLSKRVWLLPGGQGRLVRGRRRPARRPPGPLGFGQEHDPADHRRARGGRHRQRGPDRRGRHPAPGPAAGRGLRLPALRPVPPHDGARQHRLRPEGAEVARGRDQGPGRRAAGAGAALRLRGALPFAALGGPASAGRPGAGAGAAAQGAAARRALRRPGCQGPRRASHLAEEAARRGPRHQPLRHPRSARGLRGRRPDRRAQRRAGPAGRPSPGASTSGP